MSTIAFQYYLVQDDITIEAVQSRVLACAVLILFGIVVSILVIQLNFAFQVIVNVFYNSQENPDAKVLVKKKLV